ncbi:MAG TPA: SLC13 family permease [Terriglobia bacterium]|jgi:anion transporter
MVESLPLGRGKLLGAVLGILALPVFWYIPLPLEPRAQHALAITAFMVIFWIVEVVPHAVTGLLGCWLFWSLQVAPIRTAFSGFSSSEAPWFLLGALLIGLMVTESGLAKRLAFTILSLVGSSFSRILLAFILTNLVMTVLIPAGPPRVILLCTIVLGALTSFGVDHKSNIAKALIIGVVFSATLNDKTILASTPAILARSLIMEHGHVPVYWSQWLIAYAPLGLANIFAIWWLMMRLYPPEKKELPGGQAYLRQQLEVLGPWNALEKRAAFWTFTAVVLWATDRFHGVSPAVIGLGVGLAASLPGIGVLTMESMKKLNFFIVLFMGTALSMAEVLRETGAVQVLSDSLFRFIAPLIQNTNDSTIILYWTAFVAHLVLASETSMIAVSMPLVMNFALVNQLDPLALGFVWSFATGGKLFIYQSLVLIAGHTFGAYDARDILKVGVFFLFVEWLLLLLIVPLYWPLIGI